MPIFPVLTIYMAPADKGKATYNLKSRLSHEPISDVLHVLNHIGRLNLPFSLEILPYIQKILNFLQSNEKQNKSLFDNEDKEKENRIERELMDLEILDSYGKIPSNALELIGKKLGDALLSNSAFQKDLQMFYEASREPKGGDIVFHFDEKALELAAIPWELACDKERPLLIHPRGGDILLSCTRVILDQYHPLQQMRNSTLRILTIASYVKMDGPARELEQDARRRLEEALQPLRVEIDRSLKGDITLRDLERKLTNDPQADILDYYGHGSFDKSGQAMLLMKDDSGKEVSIPTVKLIALQNLPPLIVFHVCHSAQIDIHHVHRSLAPVLSNHDGIKAIVAMQCEIQMRAVASSITPALYEALAKHESLPRAVARVRQRLYAQRGDEVNWFIPVLYMRSFSQAPYFPSEQVVLPQNPFLGKRADTDEQFFVGRGKELKRMWKILNYKLSLAIIGQAGCGKTSMLKVIDDKKNQKEKLKFDREVRVVQLFVETDMNIKKAEENILNKMGEVQGKKLQDILKSKQLIILLDDIGVLDGKKGAKFSIWLKNLQQQGAQLVITNRESLTNSFSQLSESHSLLAGQITIEINLEPFTRQETRSFIIERLKGTRFKVDQFEDQLGDHMTPREVEAACWTRFEELYEPPL